MKSLIGFALLQAGSSSRPSIAGGCVRTGYARAVLASTTSSVLRADCASAGATRIARITPIGNTTTAARTAGLKLAPRLAQGSGCTGLATNDDRAALSWDHKARGGRPWDLHLAISTAPGQVVPRATL